MSIVFLSFSHKPIILKRQETNKGHKTRRATPRRAAFGATRFDQGERWRHFSLTEGDPESGHRPHGAESGDRPRGARNPVRVQRAPRGLPVYDRVRHKMRAFQRTLIHSALWYADSSWRRIVQPEDVRRVVVYCCT